MRWHHSPGLSGFEQQVSHRYVGTEKNKEEKQELLHTYGQIQPSSFLSMWKASTGAKALERVERDSDGTLRIGQFDWRHFEVKGQFAVVSTYVSNISYTVVNGRAANMMMCLTLDDSSG